MSLIPYEALPLSLFIGQLPRVLQAPRTSCPTTPTLQTADADDSGQQHVIGTVARCSAYIHTDGICLQALHV